MNEDEALAIGERTQSGMRHKVFATACVLVTSAVAAAVFVALKYLAWFYAIAVPTFQGACERLRASGLGPTPQDTICHTNWSHFFMREAASTLFIAAGFALSCLILVAAGRRLSAFVPLLALFGPLSYGWFDRAPVSGPGSTWWTLAAVALIAAPAATLLAVGRFHPKQQIRAGPLMMLASAVLLALATAAEALAAHHLASVTSWLAISDVWGSGIRLFMPILLFGAALGTNRRWWPWSIAFVALLECGVFSQVTEATLWPRPLMWELAGAVVPLSICGLIWSAWQPLAERLARWRDPRAWPAWRAAEERRKRALRPVVVLNAFAAGVLIVSHIAANADTFGIYYSIPLPTYLGMRNATEDLRTKLDLQQAISDAMAYRSTHHTFVGFDAAIANAADPTLAWYDGSPVKVCDPAIGCSTPPLVMGITQASARLIQIAAHSSSGNNFCVQRRTPGPATYGEASDPQAGGSGLTSAIASCGVKPWTSAVLTPLPALDCFHPYLLICRMVQVLDAGILKAPKQGPQANVSPTPVTGSGLVGRWQAVSYNGHVISSRVARRAFLVITPKRIQGEDGCARWTVNCRITADLIVPYGSWSMPMPYCGAQQEFIDRIPMGRSTFTVTPTSLTIRTYKGDVLFFQRAASVSPTSTPSPSPAG
jgi:hypothetical protein